MSFEGRIYANDGERTEFTSSVVSLRREKDGFFAVRLRETAFFPGGGGQDPDRGLLTFGDRQIPVLETFEDEEGVWHRTEEEIPAGTEVAGTVEESRFYRMQNHTGEHILSGTFHRLYGLSNVGFHLGREGAMTLDLSGETTPAMIEEAETEANRAVWADLPVEILYPDRDELSALDYRSKKELTGTVRLVKIPGVDLCACCAPHLSSTGKVGMIRILSSMRYKGGMRLSVICGRGALEAYRKTLECGKALGALFASPEDRLVASAENVITEKNELRRILKEKTLGERRALGRTAETTGETVLGFFPDDDTDCLRAFANEGAARAKLGLAVGGTDGAYRYVMVSLTEDVSRIAQEAHLALNGRGGGRGTIVMGSFRATKEEIRSYFARQTFASS